MSERRFLNQAQPQTLQIAVFLLYFDAVFCVFGLLTGTQSLIVQLLALVVNNLTIAFVLAFVGYVAGGYGIANEQKWGYAVGLLMAILPIAIGVFYLGSNVFRAFGLLGLMFAAALIALLVHPQSRDYQRIWFK
ncbi:MAG: hypothetical protein H0T70_03130 [Acidimicrobiia bacterium]|nr:hypothetical protein [Acidimicrobiia bacterium]